jgi:hypothetical protein
MGLVILANSSFTHHAQTPGKHQQAEGSNRS